MSQGGTITKEITGLGAIVIDDLTTIGVGTTQHTFRLPYSMQLLDVRASLVTAQTAGTLVTVDLNVNGSSILSTKITIDNGQTTSKTATTPPVISQSLLFEDSEVEVDVDAIGDGTAKGLKVILIGTWSGLHTAESNLTIAFFGDSSIGTNANAVLNMVKAEGTDIIVHAGDLDYLDSPSTFESSINAIMGSTFPYFYLAGNHDAAAWSSGYQSNLETRLTAIGITWDGTLGTQSSFMYKGVQFILTSPNEVGITSASAASYITSVLGSTSAIWRISAWHKLKRLMQTGTKPDEVDWDVYEASRAGAGIIINGHEHTYERTYSMSDFTTQTIYNTSNIVTVDNGHTFAAVIGMGGHSIRGVDAGLDTNPWWANTYNSTNGGQYGALFGKFNYNGDPTLAKFYFKDINNVTRDIFYVRRS